MTGIVFDIQRYSLHDGPGIRTVVFLKGCPLRCQWCCNPESQGFEPEIELRAALCQQCRACIKACPKMAINPELLSAPQYKIDRHLCDSCGSCAASCPSGALRVLGQRRTTEEVVNIVLRDYAYYRRSGGGVTLSGGEPLAQPEFAREILNACHERNVHTAIETTGFVEWSVFEQVLPCTDLFLYDLKHMDSKMHQELTGVPNDRILENMRKLAVTGASIIARVPLIPSCNMDERNLSALAEFIKSISISEVHLMPFHQLGKEKYSRIGRKYELTDLDTLYQTPDGAAQVKWAQTLMEGYGLKVLIGG